MIVAIALAAILTPSPTPPAPACLPLDSEAALHVHYSRDRDVFEEHALECHGEGHFRDAVTEWRKAARAGYYASYDLHAWLGIDLERSGQYAAAQHEWRLVLQLRGRDESGERAIPTHADNLFLAGQYSAAFVEYDREAMLPDDSIKLSAGPFDRSDSLPFLYHGLRRAAQGDYVTAIDDFHAALYRSPNLYAASFLLGCVEWARGDRSAAIPFWEDTLHEFPAGPPSIYPTWYPFHWAAVELLLHEPVKSASASLRKRR